MGDAYTIATSDKYLSNKQERGVDNAPFDLPADSLSLNAGRWYQL
jgi:hypothetical protein